MAVSAATAIADFEKNPNIAPEAVADTAANVAALLDGLQSIAAAGKLVSITLTDATAPTLSIGAAQQVNDAAALAKIFANANPYVYVSAVAANGIPVGSDTTGLGTAAAPFATIAKAEADLAPGQTILLNGLASDPTAYAASALTVSNTAVDSVQPFGARIVSSGVTVLTVTPADGGTMTIGKVIVDGGNTAATDVDLAASAAGAYSVIFHGTQVVNFTGVGVDATANDVSATFSGASLMSQEGVASAIEFASMASGALDVDQTTIQIKQALVYTGAVDVAATSPGASVKINDSTIDVSYVAGTLDGGNDGILVYNVQGATIEDNAIAMNASDAPQWRVLPISVATSITGALESGGFIVADNRISAYSTEGIHGIAIGYEGDDIESRGLLNGGQIFGNTISSSAPSSLESEGIFIGSEANTNVFGNTIDDYGDGFVDKNGDNAVYYGNIVVDSTLHGFLLKGSAAVTVEDNLFVMGTGTQYDYGVHAETNSVTGDATTNAVVANNTIVNTAAATPYFVQINSGQDVELAGNRYFSRASPAAFSWDWDGVSDPTYAAWQAASQERGGTFADSTNTGPPPDASPLPINTYAPLTAAEKLSAYGLSISNVLAASALAVAAEASVIAVSVRDSATAVVGNLNALEMVAAEGELTAIAFTDASAPTLSVTATTLIGDAAAIADMVGSFRLGVSGTATALQAAKLAPATTAHLAGVLMISDTAAGVASALDCLQRLAAQGKLGPVLLTDASAGSLSITPDQLSADAGALSAIHGAHSELVSGLLTTAGSVVLGGRNGSVDLLVGAGGLTLTGGGTVTLSATGANALAGAAESNVLTNVENTIAGAGQLGAADLTLINQTKGVIDATGAGGTLTLDTAGEEATNSGLIEASSGATLAVVQTAIDQLGGGRIVAPAGAQVELEAAEIIGGAVTSATVVGAANSVVFDGADGAVTIAGQISVVPGASLILSGALNVGTSGVNLTGGGEVILVGDKTQVGATAPGVTLTNVDDRIEGGGDLGDGDLVFVNDAAGLIIGSQSAALTIDTGGGTILNAGVISADSGGHTIIESAIDNTGVLLAGAGGVVTADADVSGAGTAVVNGGVLNIVGAFDQDVLFGKTGALELADAQAYAGVITGFSSSGATSLDLEDIAFGSKTTATYNGTPVSGVLTVADGSQSADIHLSGDYLASNFTLASDGHGGTTVTDPAEHAAAGPASFIATMAGFGGCAEEAGYGASLASSAAGGCDGPSLCARLTPALANVVPENAA